MNNQSNFETLADTDLDEVAGGRRHRVANRVGYVGNYGYPGAGATVPSIVGGYGYAPPAYGPAYAPAAYAPAYAAPYGYGAGYGMRLGTAI